MVSRIGSVDAESALFEVRRNEAAKTRAGETTVLQVRAPDEEKPQAASNQVSVLNSEPKLQPAASSDAPERPAESALRDIDSAASVARSLEQQIPAERGAAMNAHQMNPNTIANLTQLLAG